MSQTIPLPTVCKDENFAHYIFFTHLASYPYKNSPNLLFLGTLGELYNFQL